jgi:predicted  nucleic acid-binding Zn-ribbon protein
MIASFASIASINIEEVTRKYLVPLWTVLGDSFKTKPEEREVVVEPITSDRKKVVKKTKEKQTDNLDKTIKSLRRQLEGVSISGLEKRLDSLETNISTASESKGFDKVSLDALQSRMADNIDRIESISKRLEELEKRIKKISTVR